METKQIRYRVRQGSRIPAKKVESYGSRMREIAHDGMLTRALILKDAEEKRSPLHDWFEWDNEKAAYEYRLVQAGELLRGVMVVTEIDGEEVEFRVFDHVKIEMEDEDDAVFFIDAQKIMDDKGMLQQIISRAHKEMTDWINRYQKYSQLQPIAKELKKLLKKL